MQYTIKIVCNIMCITAQIYLSSFAQIKQARGIENKFFVIDHTFFPLKENDSRIFKHSEVTFLYYYELKTGLLKVSSLCKIIFQPLRCISILSLYSMLHNNNTKGKAVAKRLNPKSRRICKKVHLNHQSNP